MNSKIIVGLLSGVIIGLLIAPDKGVETRKKVLKRVNRISDAIQESIENAREEFNDLADASIEKIEDIEENINEAIATDSL